MIDEEKPRVVLPFEEGTLSKAELPTPVRFCLGQQDQYVDISFAKRNGKTVLKIMGGGGFTIVPMSGNLIELIVRNPFEKA